MVENDDLWNWSLIDIRLSERRTFMFVPPWRDKHKIFSVLLTFDFLKIC